MKKMNLKQMGVTPLDSDDLQTTQGGWWQIAVGLLIGAGVEIMGDWDNFKAGLSGKCEE